jgi:hypothetical protein
MLGNTSAYIADVWAKIRARDLSNSKQEWYNLGRNIRNTVFPCAYSQNTKLHL